MQLFELYATLGLDTTQFYKDVDAAKAKLLEITGVSTIVGTSASTASVPASVDAVPASSVAAVAAEEAGGASTFKDTFWGNLAANVAARGADFVLDYTQKGIERASDLTEAQNVVDVVFGSYADSLNTWAKNAKANFGLGELAAKTYAGSFADMLSSVGFDSEDVYTMSTELTQLVADIASFRNQSFEEVFTRLYSGMVGETEAIRRYGVNMTVANMEDYAASKGVYSDWKDLSSQEQYALRYDYIMGATKNAQGDFARTLESSAANQQRLLQENLNTLQTEYGSGFLEMVTSGYKVLNDLLGESAPTLTDTFSAYDDAQKRTNLTLDQTAQKATTLISILSEMEGQTTRTADEQRIWDSTLRELSNAIPGMSDMIDLATGTIEGGTDALMAHRAAWLEDSKAAAENAAQIGKLDALANAQTSLSDSQVNLRVAQEQSAAAMNAAISAANKLAAAMAQFDGLETELYFDGTIEGAEKLSRKFEDMPGWYTGSIFDQLATKLSDSLGIYESSSTEAETLTGKIEDLSGQIEGANEALGIYSTSLSDVSSETTEMISQLDQSGSAYQYGLNTALGYANGLSDGVDDVENAKNRLRNAGSLGGGSGENTGIDGYHVSGLGFVPFNGYVSELHYGEAVLPRREAEEYRAGRSARGSDTTALLAEIRALGDRIERMGIYMDKVAVGHLVAETVSQDIAREAGVFA